MRRPEPDIPTRAAVDLPRARPRAAVAGLLALVIAVGVASRLGARAAHLPLLLGKEFGDALWSVMFYLLLLLARPRAPVLTAAVLAMAVASAIECLKLWHAPWLDALRAGRFAGFLLGHTFLWRDFVSYAVGVAVAAAGDLLFRGRQSPQGSSRP
jgi:hypothetical protein